MQNELIFHNNSLKKLIKHKYVLEDLNRINKFFDSNRTLEIPVKGNGLYSAVSDDMQSISGYTYTWLRDTIMITNYQVELGKFDLAIKTIATLREYFLKHKEKFEHIIDGVVGFDDPMQRPHVRFNGDSLNEIEQKWAHAQNDALAYSLWMFFRLCNMGKHKATKEDLLIWTLFPLYFRKIEYWHDKDSGHWEEERKVECSSIGVVVAALEEMKKYLENFKKTKFSYKSYEVTNEILEDLIAKGRNVLDSTLPFESPPKRRADGALFFLIYPLNIVSENHAQSIINLNLEELQGTYGVKRYIGDSYWCPDYKKLFSSEKRTIDFSTNIGARDKLLVRGQEAQWCIFDPIISVIYGRRYLNSGVVDDLNQQIYYFNRALSQITDKAQCPELYYIEDSNSGEYAINDHVPLAWTQANVGIALEYLKKSQG